MQLLIALDRSSPPPTTRPDPYPAAAAEIERYAQAVENLRAAVLDALAAGEEKVRRGWMDPAALLPLHAQRDRALVGFGADLDQIKDTLRSLAGTYTQLLQRHADVLQALAGH